MGYREKWFAANPSRTGLYKCVKCGKKYKKEEIEIDHRIPRRKGGTDDLWNLQPMCRHCNRAKNARQTTGETAGTLVRAAVHGQLLKAAGSMGEQKLKDALGVKYERNGHSGRSGKKPVGQVKRKQDIKSGKKAAKT